jgi:hypothetical protein
VAGGDSVEPSLEPSGYLLRARQKANHQNIKKQEIIYGVSISMSPDLWKTLPTFPIFSVRGADQV